MSKHVFVDYDMTSLVEFLDRHDLDFDEFDGVISHRGQDRHIDISPTNMAIVYRDVANGFEAFRPDAIITDGDHTLVRFDFNSSKYSEYMGLDKIPSAYTVDEWFDMFEEAATIAAQCVNRNIIAVYSGRTDANMILSKGYSKVKGAYLYRKTV